MSSALLHTPTHTTPWRFKHPYEVYHNGLKQLIRWWYYGEISTSEFYTMEKRLYNRLNELA